MHIHVNLIGGRAMANMGGGADPQIPIHPLSSSSLCPLLPL